VSGAVDLTVKEAQRLLVDLGFDRERTNERSAKVLLALLRLSPGQPWGEATNPLLGTRAIMNWICDYYESAYAPNSRETIRRFTLHQFAEALLVKQNPDQPDRPVNSPKWCYQVTAEALGLIRKFESLEWDAALREYLARVPGLKRRYAAERSLRRISVELPNGLGTTLSPGGQNVLIKQMIEGFCPTYTPGGQVLYVGDADSKWAFFDEHGLASLGVTVDQHGKMPDLVVHQRDKNWLVLLEAASSHGPVDATRKAGLARLFAASSAGLVYVSCFPSRRELRKYLGDIAWETEVWCADSPSHLIHFDGEQLFGPYVHLN
jgi:type II restriction enzyme